MKHLRYRSTLYYYDGPQVIEARDTIGGHYVGVLVDDANGLDRYLCAGVAPERLDDFRNGRLDLRTLMTEGDDVVHLFATGTLDEPLRTSDIADPVTLDDCLPEPGFVLHDHPSEDRTQRSRRSAWSATAGGRWPHRRPSQCG